MNFAFYWSCIPIPIYKCAKPLNFFISFYEIYSNTINNACISYSLLSRSCHTGNSGVSVTKHCETWLLKKLIIENFEVNVRGEPIILPFIDTVFYLGRYFSSLASSLSRKLNTKEKRGFSDQTFLNAMTFPFLILSFEHVRVLRFYYYVCCWSKFFEAQNTFWFVFSFNKICYNDKYHSPYIILQIKFET